MTIEFEDSNKNNVLTFQRRNIFGCTECGSIDFHIEEGNILKVLSLSHNFVGSPNSSNEGHFPKLLLNGEVLFIREGPDFLYQTNFPFYLNEGFHTLELNTYNHYISGTLFCLEFKLTTQ